MRRFGVIFGGVGLALLVVGLSLQLLLLPAYTRVVVSRVGSAGLAGLDPQRTLELAEEVRAYVTTPDPPALPAIVDGRPGFDERQTPHLDDVRAVMIPATWLTWALAAGAVVWCAAAWRSYAARSALRRAVFGAGVGLLVAVPLLGVAGLADFDALFARFHALFFAAGTWQFYADDLIIQLFPEAFWAVSGLVWGLLIAVTAGAMTLAARLLGGREAKLRE